MFCSACCHKSAGLERQDLIDFNVILCIEKEGKKCQKKGNDMRKSKGGNVKTHIGGRTFCL